MVSGVDVSFALILLCLAVLGGGIYTSFDRNNIRITATGELIGTDEFHLDKTADMGEMGGIYLDLPITDVYEVTWLEEGHVEVKAKIAVNYRTESATFVCEMIKSAGCSND